MTRLSFIVIAFFLVIAACTAKLQQHSNNNTSINPTTVDKGLKGGAGKRDSVKTLEEKTKVSFTENATNYTYVPTMDTPAILKKDNPIWQVARVGGHYEDFWRLGGAVNPDIKITPEDFMQKYVLPNIGVSEINELRYTHKHEADKFGIGHYYYTQYYKGLKTMRHFNLSTKNGFVLNFDSSFDPLLSLNIVPIITEQQAWDSIKVFLAATDTKTNFKKYWEALNEFSKNEFPHDQQLINELTYTLSLDVDWNGKRMINLRKGDHLVYKFTLIHRSLPLETICVVDPFIGKILGYGSVNYACTHTATVDTKYGLPITGVYPTYGNKSFCVEGTVGNYVLEDISRGMKTLTYSSGTNYNFVGNTVQHNALDWNNYPNTAYPTTHWVLQQAYDHFQTKYAHVIGHPIEILLDCPFSAPQAFSSFYPDPPSPSSIYKIYLGKNEIGISENINSLDNIGHEFAHSIRSEASLPIKYSAEPAATAAEAFCDILGASFENNIANTYSWLFMNQLTNNPDHQRSFSQPHTAGTCYYYGEQLGQAAFVSEYGYWNKDEYLFKYERTGIVNHWFYLLTHGTATTGGNKTPYTDKKNNDNGAAIPDGYADPYQQNIAKESVRVDPIDVNLTIAVDRSAQIVFDVFKNKLAGNNTFIEIAYHTLKSATENSYTCDEIRSIYNAWRAVGIYPNINDPRVGTLPIGCNTSGYNWTTSCIDFDPNSIEFFYACNPAYDNVYQLVVVDNSGYNGPYSYDVEGLGTYFVPDNGSTEFSTIPLLQDYTVTVTNSNGCSVAISATPSNDCTNINTVCDFACNVYAEGSICDNDSEGVSLNFHYDNTSTIQNINLTYNGTDWTTVESATLVGTDNFTIYFPDYQIGDYIYYYATDINGCIAQSSFIPACNGDEPTPNENPVFVSTHLPIQMCYGTSEELCIYYEITDPDADYPLTIWYNITDLEPLEPTNIYSTGSETEPASGQICFTGAAIPLGFAMHVFDNRGAHTFQGQNINFIGDGGICDNHLPYLTHLKATQGTVTVAEQQWQNDGTNICLTEAEGMSDSFADFATDVTLTVNASEPLATLNLDGLWLGSVYYSLDTESTIVASTPTPNTDNTEWTITLQHNPESPYAVVSNLFVVANTLGENAYHLHFTGTDMADNPLEAMQNYTDYNTTTGCLPTTNLPTRNPNGTWTNHYAGTDAAFWLNIDQCFELSPETIIHTPPSAPIGTLNIVSTTNPIISYSVIDNELGVYTVTDQAVQHPATLEGYYSPIYGFTTFGTLPNNYTIILNYGTCLKALTGTTSTIGCQIPTTQSLITDYHTAEDSAYPEYTTLFLTLNTTALSFPITVTIAQGSIGSFVVDISESAPSYQIESSLLTNEITSQSFAISITDANGCVYTEVITPSFPVGIDDCQNTGLAFTGSYNAVTVCNGEQICLPYTVQDHAGIDDVTPVFGTLNNLNNYTQTITSSTWNGLSGDNSYVIQTGTICFDVAEQSIGEHTVTLMATTISQNPCNSYNTINYQINVTCCPTTFLPTTISPAYIGCNGNIVQGGTATLSSNATCLQDYSIINGIDHTAYNLTPGQNTLNVAANQSNYPTIVDIPSITLTNNNLTATATQTTTSQGCNDYCTATLTLNARLQIDDNNYNTNNTYTWSDCPTCNTPNRTNLCAGNYTVTVTNTTSGCTQAFTYTIQPSPQTTYNTPFDELMCCVQNTNLAISPTSQNITYPDPLQSTRPAYLVSGYQTWTPTNNPFVGITVASGDALYLGTDIVVEAGAQLNLNNLSMYFAPHCRLLVQADAHLIIEQSTLDGFCDAMWQGIQVEGLGWQQTNNGIGTVELTETTINNAVIGVAAMNLAVINFDNLISLPAATSNNYASISSLYLPYLWSIDARNTAGGQVSTNNCTFNNCFQGVNISWLGNDNNTLSETHFNSTALRLPFNNLTNHSEAGINALWVDGVGSINNCTFDNQRYGIRLNEVKKFGLNGSTFTNNLCGISSRAWLMNVEHGTYLNNNTFNNCRLAIQADGIDNLQAHQNLINTTNSSNSQLNYPTGSAGIYARGCNSLLQNNQINKVRFGIILSDSDEDGSQIAGNIINQTQEAIVCEGLNNSCYFTCNHLLDFTKFGLDVRAAGITTGKLPPQGDCASNDPAANTFVPLDAIDIIMGANTTDLYYDDVAADMLLVAYAPGTLTGGFMPETNGCNGTNLVDYCQDLRLTSIADIDQLPDGIKRDKELTKWFLTYLRDEDYEAAMTIVHKYNNNIMLRKLVPHKIDKDSVLVAETLLQDLVLNSQENTKFKELYTLLIDLQKDNRTLFDITPNELATLTDIANSSTKTAYKAQTLLYAYNGTEYPVILPYLANGDPQNHWITVFKGNQSGRISTLYPNPTTNTTHLDYQLADKQTATLQLYDLTGRQLQTHNLSGTGTYNLSLGNYPSGIYFCTILVDDVVIKTEKIVLSR